MWRTPRVIAGFLIAPLVPGAAAIMFGLSEMAVAMITGSPVPYADWLGFSLFMVAYIVVISYIAAILFGAPTFIVLNGIGRVGIVYAVLGGLMIGTIVGSVMGMVLLNQTLEQALTKIAPLSAGSAVLAAIVFWLIARPDRPSGTRTESSKR